MTASRRVLWLLFGVAGFAPSGCALQFSATDPTPDPGDGIRVPKESKFASLVKAPGETVSLAGPMPTTVVVATNTSPPAVGTVGPPQKQIETIPTTVPVETSSNSDGMWPQKLPLATNPFLIAAHASWEGRPDRVADALRSLDKPTQDAVRPLLLAAANLAMGQAATDPRDLTVTAAQIRIGLAAVERRAELRVENAKFVSFAYGYRWYDPLPKGHTFRPGEYVYFYAEVTPLAVDALPGGGIGTLAAYTLRVTNSHGQAVHLVDKKGQLSPVLVFPEKTDMSRGSVIEKHVSIGFKLPDASELVPGLYVVELEVRDQHTGRVAKQTVEFRVGGK